MKTNTEVKLLTIDKTNPKIQAICKNYNDRIARYLEPKTDISDPKFRRKSEKWFAEQADKLCDQLYDILLLIQETTTESGEPILDYVDDDGYVKYDCQLCTIGISISATKEQGTGFWCNEHFKTDDGKIKEFMTEGDMSAKLIRQC